MIRAVVKSFVDEPTGYGFLVVDGIDRDVFCHAQDLIGRERHDGLAAGDAVCVNAIVREPGGRLRALGVRLDADEDPDPDPGTRTFHPGDPSEVWRVP